MTKNLLLIAVALNLIFAYTTYSQRGVIEQMSQTIQEQTTHIQVINTKQLNENRIAREIQDRSRVSEAWANYLSKIYVRAGKKYGVDPALLVRVGDAESNFDPKALSYMGARGLQQIMPKYWATGRIKFVKSADDLYDPEINIHASAYILAYYIRTGGSTAAGVRQYHGGFRAIKNPRAITVQYQRDVLKDYRGVV